MTRTALYRHFDEMDNLLYVGITDNLPRRNAEHIAGASWQDEIHNTTVAWYHCRTAAEKAERKAIIRERPIHNVRCDAASPPEPPVDGWRGRMHDAIVATGISRRSVSLDAGQSPGYVHGLLVEGKEPTLGRFIAVCEAVGVSPAEIAGWEA